MTIKTYVNKKRKRITQFFSKRVGNSYYIPDSGSLEIATIKRVLIVRPNHRLGNQLLLTPLVDDVANTFPNCEIDLFVKGGVAIPVFQSHTKVCNIFQLPKNPFLHIFQYLKVWMSINSRHYDIAINGEVNSSSGRMLTHRSNARYKILGEPGDSSQKIALDYEHKSKRSVQYFRCFLAKLGLPENTQPIPLLDLRLTSFEINYGKKYLDALVQNDKRTICIYTNATGDKCYSKNWWESLYERLLKEYKEYNIVEMLPIENISRINFKAPNIYSRNIREMAAIIHNTAVFIAADNGVMHLASASSTPTVGLFSVTNSNNYAPYGNGSIAIDTNISTVEDIFKSLNSILTAK